jgi:hypothetical protein
MSVLVCVCVCLQPSISTTNYPLATPTHLATTAHMHLPLPFRPDLSCGSCYCCTPHRLPSSVPFFSPLPLEKYTTTHALTAQLEGVSSTSSAKLSYCGGAAVTEPRACCSHPFTLAFSRKSYMYGVDNDSRRTFPHPIAKKKKKPRAPARPFVLISHHGGHKLTRSGAAVPPPLEW